MASDDSFDLETDLLSLQFDSNIQALHSGLVSTQEAAKSEKRKCESDSSSSSDSDETESISSNVEHFQHLSVDDEDHAQTKSNDAEDVANTIFNTCFSDEDKDGDTPLHILTIFQETYKLLCFLNLCSDSKLHDLINKRNKLGQTALHIATFLQDTEMIECLLYTGADPGVQDIHGRTILHILAENGACQMLKTLAGIFEQKDFDVEYSGSRRRLTEIRNYDGFTPLHIATLNNDRNMITLLLSLGACPKMAEGRSGRTALHMAAEAGNLELVRDITAQKEINIDAKTYNGQTALVVAYHRGHSRIVDFLKEKGADHDPAIIKQYGPVKRKLQRKDNLS